MITSLDCVGVVVDIQRLPSRWNVYTRTCVCVLVFIISMRSIYLYPSFYDIQTFYLMETSFYLNLKKGLLLRIVINMN